MNYTLAISGAVVLLGVLVSALAGRRTRGGGAAFAIAIAIGVVGFFATNLALPACVGAHLCTAFGDSGIEYALYPVFAIPIFWVAAALTAK
jgi:hypothetical protein